MVRLQRYADVQSIVIVQIRFLACLFFVPIVIGLNSSRGGSLSAISSMVGGFLGCLFWSTWTRGRATHLDAVEVGIAVSLALYFLSCTFERSRKRGPDMPVRL